MSIAALILSAAVAKILIEAKVWKEPPGWLLPVGLVAIAVVAFRDNVSSAVAQARAPGRSARRSEAQMATVAALAQISVLTGISLMDLGASVFAIRNGPRWMPKPLRDKWSWSSPYLERVMRIRVADTPQASNVHWTKGKGVIGTCWLLDKPVHRDRLAVAEKHGAADITPEKFEKLRPTVRCDLSLEEFRSIVGKYAEIHAVPIKKPDGDIVGVLSVDLAAKNRTRSDGTVLNSPDVEELITTAAKLIQKSRVTG